ncbi:MAG: glycosyltransferase family 4 protein [Candidatus Peribacteraceae bacterium]
MRLLFITQKLHGQDAFGVLWVRAFQRQGYEVEVICLEGGKEQFSFPVHSLGKERGASRLRSFLTFERLIVSRRYDRVFVHMSPVWYVLGCWWWLLRGTPAYLWYTHYQMQLGVRFFGWFGKRFFCATPQSLPQFEGSKKKIVVGHGIDMDFWTRRQNTCRDPFNLLMVHRLSRSKRVEIVFRALVLLPEKYRLEIYGVEAEPDYSAELQSLVLELGLGSRVTFHGTIPMRELPEIYQRHFLILNMASETIDKTMLEAMTCGCYPVTTAGNALAIGIPAVPEADTPEAIAAFVEKFAAQPPIPADEMYQIVAKQHSLTGLVEKMDAYIHDGR